MEAVDKTPVRSKVTSIIRKAILSGQYAKGESLSLTDTATRLNVSRTPVREAFQLLELEGLIELRMNREAIVHGIDEDFIRDHFDIRALLECEAVARATTRRESIKELRKLQDEMLGRDNATVSAIYETYSYNFHHLIWKGAGSRRLHSILDSLWNGPSYKNEPTLCCSEPISEHEQILNHMEEGDILAAQTWMRKHVIHNMESILNVRK